MARGTSFKTHGMDMHNTGRLFFFKELPVDEFTGSCVMWLNCDHLFDYTYGIIWILCDTRTGDAYSRHNRVPGTIQPQHRPIDQHKIWAKIITTEVCFVQ